MSDYSCVYLVKEREFTKTNENIIKVGYSNQEHLKRFKQYPKDSILLCQVFTENGKLCESKILDEFKIQFKHRKDIGNEYFEGDYNLMRKLIIEIVDKVESDNKNFNKDIINELENKIKELEELQKKLNQEQQAHKETKEELKAMQKYKNRCDNLDSLNNENNVEEYLKQYYKPAAARVKCGDMWQHFKSINTTSKMTIRQFYECVEAAGYVKGLYCGALHFKNCEMIV